MEFLVEEIKGIAGVDEKAVFIEIVEAGCETEALTLARNYYGMLSKEEEIHNGPGKFNHYLMVTPI